jgi:TIR domain
MKTSFEYDIFISYSQQDRLAAGRLQAALEARMLKVWRDERHEDAPEASSIAKIDLAHEHSARILILWSRASVASPWVRAEAEKARQAEKIVPLVLEPLDALRPLIPPPFDTLPTIDFSSPTLDLEPLLRALDTAEHDNRPELIAQTAASEAFFGLPDTCPQRLYGRDAEMAALFKAWDSGKTRIFALDAASGAGKTTLVQQFAQAMRASGWRGASRAFAWSFSSQGASEVQQASPDEFFKAAFAHFSGGETAPPRDLHQRGLELAQLVQAEPSLLILDALEPLQYTAHGGPQSYAVAGGIKEPSIKALLKALAAGNLGLCIVTTRIRLADLDNADGVTLHELAGIPLMDAIALLRDLGVEPLVPPSRYKLPLASEFASLVPPYTLPAGYDPGDTPMPAMPAAMARDLIETVHELKGNALALTLAGKYIALHKEGDIRAIRELPELPPPTSGEQAAYRVMRAIEIALADSIAGLDEESGPAANPVGHQLALLFFLGLFNKPVDRSLLAVVFSEPAVDIEPANRTGGAAKCNPVPLKRRLQAFDDELNSAATPEWRKRQIHQLKQPLLAAAHLASEALHRNLAHRLFATMHAIIGDDAAITAALAQLAAQGLVSPGAGPAIDCPPLVRSYFGLRLKELDAETFRTAHSRLYEYYRFEGLPAAYREPMPYSLLAYKAAFPGLDLRQTIQALIAGTISSGSQASMPPALVIASREQLESAQSLIGGTEWESALKLFQPADEAGLKPVIAAIAHGCAAEREDDAFAEVYWPRIAHGKDVSSRKPELCGLELAALANFFETPFTRASLRLAPARRLQAQNAASGLLHTLGRLEDAAEPLRAAVELGETLSETEDCLANGAHNLCSLLVNIGWLGGEKGAITAGVKAAFFAVRSTGTIDRLSTHSGLGDALFQAGALGQAEAAFREAEDLQNQAQPSAFRVPALPAYQYCSLLLARGRTDEAIDRVRQMQSQSAPDPGAPLLTSAVQLLAETHAILAAVPPAARAPEECAIRAEAALAALRQSNREDYIVPGLLARAEALWRCGYSHAADEPLHEAQAMAKREPLPLLLADACLLAARINLSRDRLALARSYRDHAAALIDKHGYGRGAVLLAMFDAETAHTYNTEGREALAAAAITAVRGEPHYDERTGVTIDGGWWSLLPRLEMLLPEDDLELAKLRLARDNYNDERDAHLGAQASIPSGENRKEAGSICAELAERIIPRRDAQKTAEQILRRNGIGGLDRMKPEEQRDAIREAVYALLAETLAPNPFEIPAEAVEHMFADPAPGQPQPAKKGGWWPRAGS